VPSSMIFASLVVLWLLILVPAVAQHRQEVARPSVAALSGRVLARSPRRRSQEVDGMGERDGADTVREGRVATTSTREVRVPSARAELRPDEIDAAEVTDDDGLDHTPDDDESGEHEWAADDPGWAGEDEADSDDRVWERPPPRYRAGRGGFDAEAAALTARARYAFRQRVVLLLLFAALATGIVAGVAVPKLWWAHGAVDLMLVGYLAYLRRQVRLEENIRARRAARMAGTRRPQAADDPALDEWAERGRDAARGAESEDEAGSSWRDGSPEVVDDEDSAYPASAGDAPPVAAPTLAPATTMTPPPTLAPATTLPPVGTSAPAAPAASVSEEERPALPRLRPTPPPPLPAGTTLVDDEDDDLDLDDSAAPGYRRAAGQ
jgi:hypothetical protein